VIGNMSVSDRIWSDLPSFPQKEEIIEEIFFHEHVRIERIMSSGQVSPEGFWYDQNENEWLILLSGAAEITLQSPAKIIKLKSGESYFIAAHLKHRISWTHPEAPTLWLAVFFY